MRLRITIVFIFLLLSFTSMVSQPCLPDGITFTTQSQIDSFPINYPGCCEIGGNVYIEGYNITKLNGLSSLQSIDNSLYIVHNPNLWNLSGLDSLSYIGGSLSIFDNSSLLDVDGLNNLQYVGGTLSIGTNPILKNLSGFSNLDSCGLSVLVSSNDSLQNLEGFEGLVSTGTIGISSNNSLVGLDGLENLTIVKGTLTIANNVSLLHLNGLDSLEVIENSLNLVEGAFINLSGLQNLSHVGLFVILDNLDSLSNLNGLCSLQTIGGYLRIKKCDGLITLSGLESLTFSFGLEIIENDQLQSLSGIDNINPQSIVPLKIDSNPQLSSCEVQSICEYLASPNGTVSIFDNAPGCNTEEEVLTACESIGMDEAILKSQISAYPNPFTASTTIEFALDGKSKIQISIFNTIGEEVFHKENHLCQGTHQFSWSPHHLPAGLYYAVLRSEDGVSVVKMIKQ